MSVEPSFPAFYKDVHSREPFPWQSRLAARVLEDGRWPELLDLPTGTGKTSTIDIALYTLARRPDLFPRRIVLVVDRRVIVDQGAEHAARIRTALVRADTGPAAWVAAALRRTFDGAADDAPFTISVLRGGMPRDESWADRPDKPVVVFSTVDQAGSRLLFRGYGVSRSMSPVHAGLLGNDTLFLLDEVHLSTAFADTLHAIQHRWRRWRNPERAARLPDRWGVVRMSATPIGLPPEVASFSLADDDRADPGLARRLGAAKRAELRRVKVARDEKDRRGQFARACAEAAREHLARGAKAVAVVVNRVDTARRIATILHDTADRTFDVVLLTGRMRPLDRARVLGTYNAEGSIARRIAPGRTRSDGDTPLIVVATQSIEAGADFDFDALVTECASLDALRQRFGRVDRVGDLQRTSSTILVRQDQIGDKTDDPIYGKALAATWSWLTLIAGQNNGVVDFGIDALPDRSPDADAARQLYSRPIEAPILLPAHLDAWSQTNPRPEPDPDVSLWLHGPERDVPEVQLVWRADIDASRLNGGSDERAASDWRRVPFADERTRRHTYARELTAHFELCPPSSLESIALPVYALRSWLAGAPEAQVADVEGGESALTDAEAAEPGGAARLCVAISRNHIEILEPHEIRPGQTIAVPSSYGGIAHANWDPTSTAAVEDLGDWANLLHRGRATLRLIPAVLCAPTADHAEGEAPPSAVPFVGCAAEHAAAAPRFPAVDDPDFDARDAVDAWIGTALDTATDGLRVLLNELRRSRRVVRLGDRHIGLVSPRRARVARAMLPEDPTNDLITEDDDAASFTGQECTLARHLADVEEQVRGFAKRLGFGEDVAGDLVLAASLHDVGKADPRFQQMLLGGSEIRLALLAEPLAKSRGDARDTVARNEARRRAYYPEGYRHELLSYAMVEAAPVLLDTAADRDLVVHLIASHHGWCRPFAPAVDHGPHLMVSCEIRDTILSADAAHGLARLDSGICDRFFDVIDRYGWWGLAWLEAIIRLADHRASANEREALRGVSEEATAR